MNTVSKVNKLKACLGGMLLVCFASNVRPQGAYPRSQTWETRALHITETLVADAGQLEKHDRPLLWGRLGEVWFKEDPQRARKWFTLAVEAVEAAPVKNTEAACQRASARILLGIIAARHRALANRLVAVITSKNDESESEQLENATALADAGVSVANSDPQAAEAFAKDSLSLGFSFRVGSLLWRIHKSDPNAGDRLFSYILALAKSGRDYNLFSLLSSAVLQGPFTADKYKNLLVRSLADVILQMDRSGNDEVAFCNPEPLLPPLIPDFDRLLPAFSQRVRAQVERCQRVRNESIKPTQNAPDISTPRTVEEFLRAAGNTSNQIDRVRYLSQAARLAAEEKDFDRAISILDSMDETDKNRAADNWESWRWDYAASSACSHRKSDNLQTMNKVVNDTPQKLRAFVRVALASNCEAATGQAEIMDLLASARKDLEKADPSQQPHWYLALVRLYAKLAPETAPEILSQAIVAINRAPEKREPECNTSTQTPTVLSTQVLLNRYKLPVALLDADETGVLNAINSAKPPDIRAALRLQLLAATLDQWQRLTKEEAPASRTSP